MKYHQLIAGLFLLAGLPGVSYGQTPDTAASSELPKGPLIAEWAPDFSQWVETTQIDPSSPPDPSQKQAPQVSPPTVVRKPELIVHVVKTKDIRHVTLQKGSGDKHEVWCKGNELDITEVVSRPEPASPVLCMGPTVTGGGDWLDFSSSDFGGFTWISPDTFSGIEKMDGRDCLVFKMDLPLGALYSIAQEWSGTDSSAVKHQRVHAVAYIDLKTRLPVTLKYGSKMTSYAFSDAPASKLSLPPAIQAVIDKRLADLRAAAPKMVTP